VKEIAEMRGVNPDTDVGLAEVGFAQSLARNDANEVLASKKVLSDYFGQEIPLRYGPETEELEFLNPKTGDYELLNGYSSGNCCYNICNWCYRTYWRCNYLSSYECCIRNS
jgi:hypothetical protein